MVHAWREYAGPRPTMGNGCETRLPSGAARPECDVHPPSATEEGPGLLPYQPDKAGTLSKYTNRLTLTSICPVCGYVTPDSSAARKPPTLRSRRGYPCSSDASVGADARQDRASTQSSFSQDHPDCGYVCPNCTITLLEDEPIEDEDDPDSGDEDAGLIVGLVLLLVLLALVAAVFWLRRKNQQEAKAGRPPTHPRVAAFTARFDHSRPKHAKATITRKKAPKPAFKHGNHANHANRAPVTHHGFRFGLHHDAVPGQHQQILSSRSNS